MSSAKTYRVEQYRDVDFLPIMITGAMCGVVNMVWSWLEDD